jgi:hypothetical protein
MSPNASVISHLPLYAVQPIHHIPDTCLDVQTSGRASILSCEPPPSSNELETEIRRLCKLLCIRPNLPIAAYLKAHSVPDYDIFGVWSSIKYLKGLSLKPCSLSPYFILFSIRSLSRPLETKTAGSVISFIPRCFSPSLPLPPFRPLPLLLSVLLCPSQPTPTLSPSALCLVRLLSTVVTPPAVSVRSLSTLSPLESTELLSLTPTGVMHMSVAPASA